jgi:sugar phosphate isomerase/epimerase
MDTFTLENETLRLEFNRQNGTLVGLTALPSGWRILDRPQVGLSFRLLVPLSDERRNNPVFGEKQPVSQVAIAADKRSATFTWDSVSSETGGRLDIRLTLKVSLTARQAVYAMTVENHSLYPVENVYCPYLGDVQHPSHAGYFKTFSSNYGTASEWYLWPTYQNLRGYFGVDFPTQFAPWSSNVGAPMTPYILLRGPGEGLYAGVAAPASELVAWHTELRPGYGSSIDARVPETLTIAGKDVVTRFAAVHLPYIQPGETRSLTPVALEAYQGGWQAGVDIYKHWLSSWFKPAPLPEWARSPHAWQQLHINSPEDELRIQFRDLPKVGEECARHGVKAIQLVGWNNGGQDQGNPSHDPDPRLGAFEELKAAIASIQAMGVKIILFSKFTWADRATERFRKDLVRLAIKDPYGDYYHYGGYQYQTATQLLDINTKRLIPMCFLSEEYLQVCEQEFQMILDLGAAGILFDECQHHSPALLCFDTSHGHRYGAPVYANDRLLIQRFAKLAKAHNPEFFFAGEGCYDWEFEAYHLAYIRTENKEHIPLSRYALPQTPIMTAVTGFNDRSMVNQCLLYRYVISYEPYNFKGHLEDYPETLAYGKQMDALRTELREYFWDGEYRDRIGARVTCEGKPHHPFSVFVSPSSGKSALVVTNYDEHAAVAVEATLDNGQPLSQYRLVDDPAWRLTAGSIHIPPLSAVVVVE